MSKPTNKPGWNPSDPLKLEEPSSLKKEQGWAEGEKPSSKHFNWLFKTASEWIDHVDADVAIKSEVDSGVQEAKDYADQAVASKAEASAVVAEEAARAAADSALQSAINAEIVARETADAGFQTQINNILSNTDPAALDSLSEVVSAFEAADGNLNGAISALGTSSSSALAAEVTAREAADSDLQDAIDAEISRAQAAEASLSAAISASSGANVSLSNLSNTAINADLLPDVAGSRALGSSTLPYSAVYSRQIQLLASNNATVAILSSSTQFPSGAGGYGLVLPSTVSGAYSIGVASGNKSGSNSNSLGVRLESGNATGATSNSGDIDIQTGTATGTRGKISLNANTVDVNSTRIINVATPTSANDAVNKAYADSAAQFGINAFIELPAVKEYTLIEQAPRAMTIDTLRVRTSSGTCRVTVRINGAAVTGLSAIEVTDQPNSYTATGANAVALNGRVTILVENVTATVDLGLTIKVS